MPSLSTLCTRALEPSTWSDFAALVERHHGVWGGCWRQIAALGGGTVESYPEDAAGRSVSSAFLHNGSVTMFERQGYTRLRPIGKNHWVMAKAVASAHAA